MTLKTFLTAAFVTALGLTIAPVSASASTCAMEGKGLISINANTSTELHFINKSTGPRSLYWLNYDGVRVFYMRLNPGENYVQQTYVTHPWVVVADDMGTCTQVIMPAPTPTDAVLN